MASEPPSARNFTNSDGRRKKIQEASRSLFEHTTGWDEHVKRSYEISKATRTFVLPLLLLLVYEIVGWPLGDITPEFRKRAAR